jgi:hypothetical protein
MADCSFAWNQGLRLLYKASTLSTFASVRRTSTSSFFELALEKEDDFLEIAAVRGAHRKIDLAAEPGAAL